MRETRMGFSFRAGIFALCACIMDLYDCYTLYFLHNMHNLDGSGRMNNVKLVTGAGMCVGCGACAVCEYITFKNNELGFPVPVVDEQCDDCGECLKYCDYGNND